MNDIMTLKRNMISMKRIIFEGDVLLCIIMM